MIRCAGVVLAGLTVLLTGTVARAQTTPSFQIRVRIVGSPMPDSVEYRAAGVPRNFSRSADGTYTVSAPISTTDSIAYVIIRDPEGDDTYDDIIQLAPNGARDGSVVTIRLDRTRPVKCSAQAIKTLVNEEPTLDRMLPNYFIAREIRFRNLCESSRQQEIVLETWYRLSLRISQTDALFPVDPHADRELRTRAPDRWKRVRSEELG